MSVPLWLIFAMQSLVVALSFIAVILVLVLQQQTLFEEAVFEKIDLHLQRSNYAITSPLIAREGRFTQLKEQMLNSPDMWYHDYMNQSSDAIQRFNNFSYYLTNDPIVFGLFQHTRHSTITHANGDRMYAMCGMNQNRLTLSPTWTENELANVYFHTTFPLTYGSTPLLYPYPVSHELWSLALRKQLTTGWGRGGVSWSTASQSFNIVSGLGVPLIIDPVTQEATLSFAYSFDVSYMTATVVDALLSPASKLLLYDGVSDLIMTTRNTGQPEFNMDDLDLWNLTSFPDQTFIHQFVDYAEVRCQTVDNCTRMSVVEDSDIVSIMHMTTDYGYPLQLFQVTPRSHFFASGEKAVTIGIIIGVVAAVLVLISCVVIWFAIRKPIQHLRESMDLAAVMRNDEVSDDTGSILTELDLLSQSFMQMNNKLLQARAFMPQSMLYADDSLGDEEDATSKAADDDRDAKVHDEGSLNPSQHQVSPTRMSSTGTDFESSGLFHEEGAGSDTLSTSHEITNRRRQSTPLARIGIFIPVRTSMAKAAFTSKRVSVLIINARGTHELAVNGGTIKLEREQVRLIELVEKCARAEKGVVDAFQGDHFVLTFNAARVVGTPARNGALVAMSISEGAQRDGMALCNFSMGLSYGRAQIGDVGSATLKKNCTVGSVYTNAVGLERLAKRVEQNCLVHGRPMAEIELVAYCQCLGIANMGDRGKDRDTLWAIKNRVNNEAAEWLYEMETATKGNPYQAENDALVLKIKAGQEASTSEHQPEQLTSSSSPIAASSSYEEYDV